MNYIGLTGVENCTFFNNFGPDGGSIKLEYGGILQGVDNKFSLDKDYLTVPYDL